MARKPTGTKPPTPETSPDAAAPAEQGYTVLARRYRPQTFADLVGQEAVARALTNAIKGSRVAHAYLFTGARGVGKTSTARILAKALNCVNGPTPTPCGVCEICQAIASGDDVDVLEIDGASNRRIDEIRDIRNNVQYRPSRSRYKIYIVDEVHMLTKEAFNALLKTLEEPPPHVKFIFATTEVEKVPITILSRCQRFDFNGIPLPTLIERLRAIVAAEGMQADDDALELVARRAGGSMRDAQSLLDQLLAFGNDRLTAEQVHQLLGTAGDDRVIALAEAVFAHDPKKALELLDEYLLGALQLGELVDQLIRYWRDLMVAHCAGAEGPDLSVPAKHRETLLAHAKSVNLDTLLAGLDILSATKARMLKSAHGRTLVEMALVRLGRLEDLVPLATLTQLVAQGSAAAPTRVTGTSAPSGTTVAPPEGVKKNGLVNGPAGTGVDGSAGFVELTPETLTAVWPEVLSKVGTLLRGDLLRANLPAFFGPNSLVLRFPEEYNKAKESCQAPGNVAKIDEVLKKLTGKPWNLKFETLPSAAAGASGPAGPDRTSSAPRTRKNPREEAALVPLVRRVLELGGQIVRADDGFAEGTRRPDHVQEPRDDAAAVRAPG